MIQTEINENISLEGQKQVKTIIDTPFLQIYIFSTRKQFKILEAVIVNRLQVKSIFVKITFFLNS